MSVGSPGRLEAQSFLPHVHVLLLPLPLLPSSRCLCCFPCPCPPGCAAGPAERAALTWWHWSASTLLWSKWKIPLEKRLFLFASKALKLAVRSDGAARRLLGPLEPHDVSEQWTANPPSVWMLAVHCKWHKIHCDVWIKAPVLMVWWKRVSLVLPWGRRGRGTNVCLQSAQDHPRVQGLLAPAQQPSAQTAPKPFPGRTELIHLRVCMPVLLSFSYGSWSACAYTLIPIKDLILVTCTK